MQRRNVPTLEEALQVVLGRSRPTSAAVATSAVPRSTTENAAPKQFTWSPMFMSPGSSQNPVRLGGQGSRPSSGPVARARWQDVVPAQEAALRDVTLNSFTNSRGLFQQTLTSHQHAMASRHQMALREIGTAINPAVENTPNGVSAPADDALPSLVDGNTTGCGSTLPGSVTARTMPEKCLVNNFAVGSCSRNMVRDDRRGTADAMRNTVGESASVLLTDGVLGQTLSQDSTLSSGSVTAACQSDFNNTRDVGNRKFQASDAVLCNSSVSGQGMSASFVVEKSDRNPVGTDVSGNAATRAVGVVRVDSYLWEGLHPASDRRGTGLDDDHSRSRADWIMTNLPAAEAGTDGKGKSGSIEDGVSVSTGTVNMSEDVRNGGGVVTGNGSAVDRVGMPSTNGGSPSSFFLHRNAPSPNIAIVQPSVHTNAADHCSVVRSVYPTSTTSGGLQEQDVASCGQNANTVDRCCDKDSTHPTSNVSSGLLDCLPQERSIPSCATESTYQADNAGVGRQPVVGFVSTPSAAVQAPRPPNTMTVLPPEKDRVLPRTQPPETYGKPSSGEAQTGSGTIFAIPPSYVPAPCSNRTEFSNHESSVLGFPNDKYLTLDFPSATCIKDNITYEEIPVDDTSSVSSITSDITAAATSTGPGQ